MTFRKCGIFLLLIFCLLLPIYKINAQDTNAGFVSANIWYSKDPFTEGDKIKVYTLIFNPDTRQLSGTVVFFDKDTILGTKDFAIAGGTAKDLSTNWTVSVGQHTIYGQIQNARFLNPDGTYENVSLANSKTEDSVRTVQKKIIPVTIDDGTNTIGKTVDSTINSIETVSQTVKNSIPAPIAETTNTVVSSVDTFRNNTGISLEKSKQETKNTIDTLNNVPQKETGSKNLAQKESAPNYVEKPFEYIKLFFLTILSFIFNTKIVFYALLVIVTFFILRFFWRFVFD